MIFRYGNYTHDRAEVHFTVQEQPIVGDTGVVIGQTVTWQGSGRLQADSRAQLTTRINQLRAAYSVNNRDMELLDIDGTTITSHRLLTANAINGVRITNFAFADSRDAEYSTFRNYTFTAEAVYNTIGVASASISYQSSVAFTGTGGPRFVVRTALNGNPIRQQVAARTPISAVQSGSRTSLFGQPIADPPIYASGGREQQGQRNITNTQGRQNGNTTFTTSWTYHFLDNGTEWLV